jgi:hypothetical protein
MHIQRFILHCLAGGIAERLARRDGQASGLQDDRRIAVSLIRVLFGSRSPTLVTRHFKRMHARADALVRRHWSAISDVAEMLLEEKTVSERAVLCLLREQAVFETLRSRA